MNPIVVASGFIASSAPLNHTQFLVKHLLTTTQSTVTHRQLCSFLLHERTNRIPAYSNGRKLSITETLECRCIKQTANTIYYTVSQKKDTKLLAITSPSITDFQNFFTSGLGSKFATNSCLNIPTRFKDVATLPCKI